MRETRALKYFSKVPAGKSHSQDGIRLGLSSRESQGVEEQRGMFLQYPQHSGISLPGRRASVLKKQSSWVINTPAVTTPREWGPKDLSSPHFWHQFEEDWRLNLLNRDPNPPSVLGLAKHHSSPGYFSLLLGPGGPFHLPTLLENGDYSMDRSSIP